MNTITIQDAQAGLSDLIHGLKPGQFVTITENDRPVAQLAPLPIINPDWSGYPHAGSAKGLIVVPDDFDAPLDELREYME